MERTTFVRDVAGMGNHAYDNVQSEFLVSYTRTIHGNISDG